MTKEKLLQTEFEKADMELSGNYINHKSLSVIHSAMEEWAKIQVATALASYAEQAPQPIEKIEQLEVTGKSAGADLIAKERLEQIEKHHRTINWDVVNNKDGQLLMAAKAILAANRSRFPSEWDVNIIQKMCDKPYQERIIIAGAFLAAEYDRTITDSEWQQGSENQPATDWNTMSLAPTDGTDILITLYDAGGNYKGQNVAHWSYEDNEGYPCDGHWKADSGKYGSFALYYVHPELSRWRYLPDPSESGEAGKQPEQQPADRSELVAFAEWILKNEWNQRSGIDWAKYMTIYSDVSVLTTAELYELFLTETKQQ